MTKNEIQEKALTAIEGYKRSGVALGTGVGKTRMGLMFIEKNFSPLKNILIVAPKKSIFEEWQKEADSIGKSFLLNNATFCTYLSINKKEPKNYDTLILDECHSLLESHESFLSEYNGSILGLTGTPPKREHSEKARMVNKYCPIQYTYIVDDAVEDGLLNDYKIYVHELKLSKVKNVDVNFKNRRGFKTSEIENYTYWTNRLSNANGGKERQICAVMRMKAMMDYPSKEIYARKLMSSITNKCIVFANTQEQADKLCNHSYHSNNPDSLENLEDFKNGNIDKLSCVLQLSEGVNIPDLKQGIILHAYGNERKSAQRIGRLLRLNPDEQSIIHILCFVDTVDKEWVTNALSDFDSDKITWKDFNIKLY
jgi:superfamily II DNA or RNA helicase